MKHQIQFFARELSGVILTVTVAVEQPGESLAIPMGVMSIFKHALTNHVGLDIQHQTGPVEVPCE